MYIKTPFLKYPSCLNCVFRLVATLECLSFPVQNDPCAQFDNRSFQIHHLVLGGGLMSRMCDIKDILEASPAPLFSIHIYNEET